MTVQAQRSPVLPVWMSSSAQAVAVKQAQEEAAGGLMIEVRCPRLRNEAEPTVLAIRVQGRC